MAVAAPGLVNKAALSLVASRLCCAVWHAQSLSRLRLARLGCAGLSSMPAATLRRKPFAPVTARMQRES
jgi:hypothetical protein